MKKMEEKQQTQEVALKEEQQNGLIQANLGNKLDVNFEDTQAIAKALKESHALNFKANMDVWSPKDEMESIKGIYWGITTIQLPKIGQEDKLEDVEGAVLLTPGEISNKDGEVIDTINMTLILNTHPVGFFKRQPLKTLWTVVYSGEKKSKKGMTYKEFNYYPEKPAS